MKILISQREGNEFLVGCITEDLETAVSVSQRIKEMLGDEFEEWE